MVNLLCLPNFNFTSHLVRKWLFFFLRNIDEQRRAYRSDIFPLVYWIKSFADVWRHLLGNTLYSLCFMVVVIINIIIDVIIICLPSISIHSPSAMVPYARLPLLDVSYSTDIFPPFPREAKVLTELNWDESPCRIPTRQCECGTFFLIIDTLRWYTIHQR